jgi:hypothetical protein
MPFSAGPTPSPQSNNPKAQFEQTMLEKYPGTNMPKYDKRGRTNRDGKNVWDIYEYDGRGYNKINNNLSMDANNFLVPPLQHSRQNFLPALTDDTGGVPGGGVDPTQYSSSTNPNSNSPPDFSSSGEGATWHNENSSTAGWMGGRRRRSRKSKKSRKSRKSKKSRKSYRKSRRYRR